tara:strand:- start:3312 stop:4043 length:732 start_codon:yes stop_codon:yes gene_type:complete
MHRFLLALFFFSILIACKTEEESATTPSLYNFKINSQLMIVKLHLHEDYQLSFTASDESNLKSYRLELIHEQKNENFLIRENDFQGRQVSVVDTFKFSNTAASLGKGYQLRLTVQNKAGLSRTLTQDVEVRDGRPLINVALQNPGNGYSANDAVYFRGTVSDYEDLLGFEIYLYRQEPRLNNPRMGTILHEFNGANDTLYTLGANDYFVLPSSLVIDNYALVYRLTDSSGNVEQIVQGISLNF